MTKHPKRRTSPPVSKQFRFKLRPGDRLVTPTVILTVPRSRRSRRQAVGGVGALVTVECTCTKAEPNRPDCKPKSTRLDNTISVSCVKSGGCQTCKQSVTTTTTSVVMA